MKQALASEALRLGFCACKVTLPGSIPQAPAQLQSWLQAGYAGGMDWMAETQERRADPYALWPQARSIILLGMNYGPDSDPMAALANRNAGNVSVYARNRDYHGVIKGKLKHLGQWLASRGGPSAQVKVFVDTAPIMEKPLAAAAGLGWQGKHTNLVSRLHGSWLLLGSLFTTLALPPDEPEPDHCGTCRACLDICPTQAFPSPYQLDARRCISYLTIEHKGHIAAQFRQAIGNRIYGCDDCLAVCPWNKFAEAAAEAKLRARADLTAPDLAFLVAMEDTEFRQFFAGGPIKRIGHDRFLRNVLIAIGNSGLQHHRAAAVARLAHKSSLVRAMAVWALGQLLPQAELKSLAADYLPLETDDCVRSEWRIAMEVNL